VRQVLGVGAAALLALLALQGAGQSANLLAQRLPRWIRGWRCG
jgi:hypothetical protein